MVNEDCGGEMRQMLLQSNDNKMKDKNYFKRGQLENNRKDCELWVQIQEQYNQIRFRL